MATDDRRAPSALAAAISHPLGWLMLGAAAASAFFTGSLIPLALGAAAQAVWLAIAARTPIHRGYLEHVRAESKRLARLSDEQALLRRTTEADRRRFLELDRVRADIRGLVASGQGVSSALLVDELPKVDHLVQSFLRIATRVARQEELVEGSDLNALEDQVRKQRAVVEKSPDAESKATAAQSLELMEERLEHAAEVRRQIRGARGQLQLVENALALLRDRVASMDAPDAITGQLDALVSSVDAIDVSAKETDALLGEGRPARRALAQGTGTQGGA